MDNLTPIVVVAYNRPKSLSRLLNSLAGANYEHDSIPLIISIDKSDTNEDVVQLAKAYHWAYGKKTVVYRKENLGLKKHVLLCAAYCLEYGSVVLLEDDLFVSPSFYTYALEALKFSNEKSYIGGISLYNHQFNVHKREGFTALEDGYDNWYFQFASSWGQAWTKKQFEDFSKWYTLNDGELLIDDVPEYVLSWSQKSWLKYYIAYLVVTDKYFLYPKISLSTNFSDSGTHIGSDSTIYQVPLLDASNKSYNFSSLHNSNSVYDSFFENAKLFAHFNVSKEDLTVDLYGYRHKFESRYVLTSKLLDYKILKTFGRSLRPIDANIKFGVSGNDFFLYDTSEILKNKSTRKRIREINYRVKSISTSDAAHVFFKQFKSKIDRLLKRIL